MSESSQNAVSSPKKSKYELPPLFLVGILDKQRQTAEELRLSLGKPALSEIRDLSGNLIVLPQ